MWRLKEIYYHRKDHYLSILAVMTAIFLLLAVSIMCDSGEELLKRQVKELGLDVTMVQANNDSIPPQWQKDFIRKYGISDFSEFISIPYGKLQIVSCDPALKRMFSINLKKGVFLDECDSLYNADKVVLGHESWLELGQPDLGELICLNGVYFTVSGILEQYSENLFIDLDHSIFIPQDYHFPDDNGSVCYYFCCEGHYVDDYLEELFGPEGCVIISQQGTGEAIDELGNAVRTILTVISAVSLIVALIGLVSSSLNNVSRRSYEIGIKKSLGASDRDIYRQFVLEAAVVITISVMLALRAVSVIVFILPDDLITVDLGNCAKVIIRTVITGMICSLYPAFRAARTTVIESIRQSG